MKNVSSLNLCLYSFDVLHLFVVYCNPFDKRDIKAEIKSSRAHGIGRIIFVFLGDKSKTVAEISITSWTNQSL